MSRISMKIHSFTMSSIEEIWLFFTFAVKLLTKAKCLFSAITTFQQYFNYIPQNVAFYRNVVVAFYRKQCSGKRLLHCGKTATMSQYTTM